MKATIEPQVAERTVTLTLTEGEAFHLKQFFGFGCQSKYDRWGYIDAVAAGGHVYTALNEIV